MKRFRQTREFDSVIDVGVVPVFVALNSLPDFCPRLLPRRTVEAVDTYFDFVIEFAEVDLVEAATKRRNLSIQPLDYRLVEGPTLIRNLFGQRECGLEARPGGSKVFEKRREPTFQCSSSRWLEYR